MEQFTGIVVFRIFAASREGAECLTGDMLDVIPQSVMTGDIVDVPYINDQPRDPSMPWSVAVETSVHALDEADARGCILDAVDVLTDFMPDGLLEYLDDIPYMFTVTEQPVMVR